MAWLTNLLLTYCAIWLLAMLFAAWRFGSRRGAARPLPLPAPLPRVSVLIAARDEEAALSRCMAAVRRLRYPAHLLEVLLGDDHSTDRTAAVAEAAMRGFAGQFRVVPIGDNLGAARGKANVLAYLAQQATTEFLFITDADIAVPATWVETLLAQVAPGVGTVTGITAVCGPRLFDHLQGLDWLLSLGMVQVVSELGRPVTAMGNNMLVTRAAYQATGGYETLPFSVTEDFTLFAAVRAQGFGFRHVFEVGARADSLPMPTWAALLRQRRRWLRGVQQLPRRLRLELLVFSGIWPALLGLSWVAGPGVALSAWGLKIGVQGLLAALCFRRAGLRLPVGLLFPFELYTLFITLSLVWMQAFGGGPVVWKGREYQ